jgi:tetratricopeptide (TPR) repeat protein
MQQGMYQPAYEALQAAMAIQSGNPILAYYAAVCCANLSKAQVEVAVRSQWLQRAEGYYRRALELDPGYVNALYGLAILYVFELDRPQDAVPLLERVLKRETRNMDAQLLLGNAYYRAGRLEDALGAFQDVAAHANVDAQRQEAQANARRIEEELHGAP